MFSAIVLDILLLLIVLLMVPLGFLRGGLREVSTSAGLLFGILLAVSWSGRWGDWFAARLDIQPGAAEFLVSLVAVVAATAAIGYGGSAAFDYRPGPGGRMYGALLAFLNGIIFNGFMIDQIVITVYEGDAPDAIGRSYIARAISVGFEWMLLAAGVLLILATVFGLFVRERKDEDFAYVPPTGDQAPAPRSLAAMQETATIPAIESDTEREAERPSTPVRIREVRHWEEEDVPSQEYRGGWRQTWPDPKRQGPALPWEQQPPPRSPSQKRVSRPQSQPDRPKGSRRDVIRDFVSEDEDER